MYNCPKCNDNTMVLTGYNGINASFSCNSCLNVVYIERDENGMWKTVSNVAAVLTITNAAKEFDWQDILGGMF